MKTTEVTIVTMSEVREQLVQWYTQTLHNDKELLRDVVTGAMKVPDIDNMLPSELADTAWEMDVYLNLPSKYVLMDVGSNALYFCKGPSPATKAAEKELI